MFESFNGVVELDDGVAACVRDVLGVGVLAGVVILWVSCLEVIRARLASLESTEAVS